MNIQRFYAATAREALAKARMVFGDGTLILSNRQTPQGVEVVATTEESLATLDQVAAPAAAPAPVAVAPAPRAKPAPPPSPAPLRAAAQTPVEEDAAQLAMSTLSFQDYVRERMLQRRAEAQQAKAAAAPRPAYEIIPPDPESPPPPVRKPVAAAPAPQPAPAPAPVAAAPMATQGLVNELNAMKELIEDRFSTLAWLGQTKQSPIRANLTLKLIRSGYSPALARAVLSMMPDDASPAEAMQWLLGILTRNIKTDAGGAALKDEGGVFALVGTTGVGKTTTAAKLAALCARTHGAGSVGLITLDSYRIGAHEQLRAYGRMLGVVAHMAHDRAALQDLLGLLANRKMVIIDTTGVAPRDPRKREMLDLLNLPQIKRLLVLNASSHGDNQDEAMASFGAQQAVLTKIDEAVKLGPALDAVIRNHLVLRGVSGGQRVPEDWERADADQLVRMSMRSTGKSAHDPQMAELGLYFAQVGAQSAHAQGRLHA